MLMTVIGFTTLAAVVQSARATAYRQRIDTALRIAGIKHSDAARTMGISEKHFSDFLRGLRPLSAHRLADLPDEFQSAFDALNVAARGGVVLTDDRLVRLLDRVDRLVMAKCELPGPGSAFDRMVNPVKAVS